MEQPRSPASRVIAKAGGAAAVAAICAMDVNSVYYWTYPKAKGGTGGIVPAAKAAVLLKWAAAEGIDLTPADFFDVVSHNAGAGSAKSAAAAGEKSREIAGGYPHA